MQTEIHYKTKTIINILMASMTFLLLAVFIFNVKLPCIFKMIFHIECPACGLTRSFRAIMNLKFYESIKYNILGIPLFLMIIVVYVMYFIDLICKNNILSKLYDIVSDYYILIIILFLIIGVLNNIST